MSIGKDGSQRPVPTLTEVVQLPTDAAGAGRNPTNPVVTPTLRKMSVDDAKKAGADAGRNRLSTVLPPPTLPPVLVPGHLPVVSTPIAMPSPVFAPAQAHAPVPLGSPVAPATSTPAASPVPEPGPMPEPAPMPTPMPTPMEPADEQPIELASESPPSAIVPTSTAEPPMVPIAAQPLPLPGSADESRLLERVLADVQQHIDLMLEHRLRDMLAPAFERLARSMLAETRDTMSRSLREIVASSVARELEKARIRNG